jgi:diguanylate cyclase (GGDEF)-like protein/PAS domain S-box-containing protein
MRGYSIRWFLLILVLIALAPGLVSTSFEIRHSFRQQTEAALEITQTAANAAARRVDNFLANAKKIAVSAAARPEIGLTDPRRCSAELAALMSVLPSYANAIVIDGDGRVVCSAVTRQAGAGQFVDRAFYFDRMLQTGQLTVGYPSPTSSVIKSRIVGIAQPLKSEDGRIAGALVLAIDLARFVQEMPDVPNMQAFLVAGNGSVVSATVSPDEWISSGVPGIGFFAGVSAPAQLVDEPGPDGRPFLVAKVPVAEAGWTMIAGIPTEIALSGAYQYLRYNLAVYAFVLILTVTALLWVGYRIVAPLEAVIANVHRIKDGDRPHFSVRGPLEIRMLAAAANEALDEAEQREKLLHIADQRLAFALEANRDGVWEWNLADGSMTLSERWLAMLGYEDGEIERTPDALRRLVHPEDDALVEAAARAHLAGETPQFVTEHRMRRKDGGYMWVLNRGAVVERDAAGRPLRLVGTHTDIDSRKAAEADLKRAGIVFDKSPQAIVVTDADNRIELVNPAFEKVTGYAAAEVIGRNPSILSSGRQPPEFYKAMWQTLKDTGEWQGEVWNRRKDGSAYCEWLTVTQVRQGDRVMGYIGMFIDVTRRKEVEEQLEWRAHFDPLTMLPNRHLLLDRIDQAIRRSRRSGHSGAILMLDLDHFKEINDTLGHQAGDAVLVEVARRLHATMRENDTAGRLGGDEFVILLSDLTEYQAIGVAERIIDALGKPVTVEGRALQIGGSLGVVLFPSDGDEPGELLRLADMAMYKAKAAGRGGWQMFKPEMDASSRQRLETLTELRTALQQDQIELHYQPIVDLRTGRIAKAEGLARWRHPQRGFIPPALFIPLAEETGMIHQLGHAVLQSGLAARRRIDAAGMTCHIGINVSSRQLDGGSFIGEISQALAAEDMSRNALIVEVTESLLLSDFERTCGILQNLADAGATIALDDFGTGYSSLNYLCRLPAKVLKIDRSFVAGIDERVDLRRLVRGVIELGHDLGLTVVAEGVETAAQRDCLVAMGCDFAQGYHFARPMPLDDLLALLAAQAQPAEVA